MKCYLRVHGIVKEHEDLIGSSYVHPECMFSIGEIIFGQDGHVVLKRVVEVVGLGGTPDERSIESDIGIHSGEASGDTGQVDGDS